MRLLYEDSFATFVTIAASNRYELSMVFRTGGNEFWPG